MARKKNTEDTAVKGGDWIATFSDTMTLLLTFFILLYSFSSVDAQKLEQISTALQNVLEGKVTNSIFDYNMKYGEVPVVGEIQPDTIVPIDNAQENMLDKVRQFINSNNMEAVVQIKEDSRGIIIQLRDNILFESASASLKKDSKDILEKISGLINTFDNDINVEGHTDNVPIRNYKYESNWELSTARAGSVLRYFVEEKNMNPQRFKASGYAEYQPLVPNDTEEHKAMNRRVNILIVANEKEKSNK